jgi:U4/U6 small nuclear ribonucleoprotein PRP4
MTLFGEGVRERRDRLKQILTQLILEDRPYEFEDTDDEEEKQTEEYYTFGGDELTKARSEILKYSIQKAKERIQRQRDELDIPFSERKKSRHEFYHQLNNFQTKSIQLGDERPIGFCEFSPNSKLLGTASWSGLLKLYSVPESECLFTLRGHKDRVSSFNWFPTATTSQPRSSVNLVSGGTDGSVHLWSLCQDTPIASLQGHQLRVARLAFHPSGRFVGTASFDTTWRLWDTETQQELLLQEGHSREVFSIGFQPDGALVSTAGYDSIGRVWDLRTGRSIMVLSGHIKPILSLDWSNNGYQLATGGEDHSIRIWDIRTAKCVYTIPAHKSTVTQVRYWKVTDAFESKVYHDWKWDEEMMDTTMDGGDPKRRSILDSSYLISSSYDGTCKLWTDGDYKPFKAVSGLEGRIMCVDISGGTMNLI